MKDKTKKKFDKHRTISIKKDKEKKCHFKEWCYFQPSSDVSEGCKDCDSWHF